MGCYFGKASGVARLSWGQRGPLTSCSGAALVPPGLAQEGLVAPPDALLLTFFLASLCPSHSLPWRRCCCCCCLYSFVSAPRSPACEVLTVARYRSPPSFAPALPSSSVQSRAPCSSRYPPPVAVRTASLRIIVHVHIHISRLYTRIIRLLTTSTARIAEDSAVPARRAEHGSAWISDAVFREQRRTSSSATTVATPANKCVCKTRCGRPSQTASQWLRRRQAPPNKGATRHTGSTFSAAAQAQHQHEEGFRRNTGCALGQN